MPRDRDYTPFAPGNALVASASKLNLRDRGAKTVKVRKDIWQQRAWHFYDCVPEFYYAASWVGNMVSKAKFVIKKNGKVVANTPANDLIASIGGGPQGQSELLRQMGIHLSVGGEFYLVGEDRGNDPDKWSVMSNQSLQVLQNELRANGYSYTDPFALRVWRPHPGDGRAATSPARPVIPVLAELEGLTKRVAADIDSRLTSAGLLIVPTDVEFPSQQVTNAAGDTITTRSGVDGFQDMLIDAASIAIVDQESASARVPLVAGMPGDQIAKVKFITFWTEFDAETKGLREEAIRRLALGMDMPPEVLTGTGDSNHWNAWAIEEASIKTHIEPLLNLLAESLTIGFLRGTLIAGNMTPEDAAQYSVDFDTVELRLRPNRSKEATELYDRGALSLATMLRENGFDPDTDKMPDPELQLWLLKKVASGSTTPEQVAEALRALGVTQISADSGNIGTEERPVPSLTEHPTRDIPDPADAIPSDAALAAANVLVYRALERAGNRLKSGLPKSAVTASASELYRNVNYSQTDIDDLLKDAFAPCEQFGLGDHTTQLAGYCSMLLATKQPHDPKVMARWLSGRAVA